MNLPFQRKDAKAQRRKGEEFYFGFGYCTAVLHIDLEKEGGVL